jgi:3-oxoacyl-[acyl-carrier-protein] synthase III
VSHKKLSRIVSAGFHVPGHTLSNSDLEKFLDTSDEWIMTRTGIRNRHICTKEESMAYELGGRAAAAALARAHKSAPDIDGIVCATFSPDYFFPSTACKIQEFLGCKNAFCFDVSAACAGFVYALSVADAMIVSGRCKTMLVVGTEITSKTLDWKDRSTCILFGDGAGAVVIEQGDSESRGILSTHLRSNGGLSDILSIAAWGESRYMKMNGNEVFKHAVRLMADSTEKCLAQAGLSVRDIDLFIPHQANIRIIDAVGRKLKIPGEKIVINLERYGNTSSASIPIALDEAWTAGRIREGSVVVFSAVGGGLVWGSAVVRF